jgi:hypothetical protein
MILQNHDKMLRKMLLWLFLGLPVLSFANDNDKPKEKNTDPFLLVTNTLPINTANSGQKLSNEMQSSLSRGIKNLERQMAKAVNRQAIDKMLDLKERVTVDAHKDRAEAEKLYSYLDANQDHIQPLQNFNLQDQRVLPVGLYTGNGNNKIMLGLLEVKFYSDYAEAKAFLRIQFSLNGKVRDLYFGLEGLKFTNKGFIQSDVLRMSLLGDFIIPGEKWSLIFKGGTGAADRSYTNSKTYVEFDCGDFSKASLAMQVVFPKNVLLPFDPVAGTPITDGSRVALNLEGSFTKDASGANFLAELDFSNLSTYASSSTKAFCIPGMQEFGFELDKLVFDNSNTQNQEGMVFPDEYVGDVDPTWKGIYIKSFKVILPKSFQKDEAAPSVSKLGAYNILIDRTGFSGKIAYTKSTLDIDNTFSAQKWKFGLKELSLTFVQSNFKQGSLGGLIQLPVNEDEATGGMIGFTGRIINSYYYEIEANVAENLNVNCKALSSKLTLETGSWVKLERVAEKFYPSCSLSGSMVFMGKESAAPANEAEADNVFKGITFQGFKFETKNGLKVSLNDILYNNNGESNFRNFPVTITKIQKNTAPTNPDDLWIDFGFGINITKDITGFSDITLKATNTGGKLHYAGVKFNSIAVDAQTSAFRIVGFLKTYNAPSVDGVDKGIRGKLDLTILKPAELNICATANFGYRRASSGGQSFGYGYVDGFMQGAPGAGVPLFGPILINGAGAGLYYNMRPSFNSADVELTESTSTETCGGTMFVYSPDYQIPLGIKVMLGLTNSSGSFNARGSLDFALNRTSGINHIALSGVGTIGESATSKPENTISSTGRPNRFIKEDLKEEGKIATPLNSTPASLTNDISETPNNTKDLLAKAKAKNETRNNGAGTTATADIAFDFGMMLDFPNKSLHSELAVWVNKGDLHGVGHGGLVGRAVLHADPSDFYLHIGKASPKNARIGLRYGDYINMDAYIMIGSGIPSFPPPPRRVVEYLRLDESKFGTSLADLDNQITGRGIALGASISMTYKNDITNKWRVEGAIDAGFDIMLRNTIPCNNGNKEKFFFNGQLYGYGDFSVYRKEKKKAGMSLGIYLFASGPGPFGAEGVVKFRPPVIGFLTGDIEAGVSVGSPCRIN